MGSIVAATVNPHNSCQTIIKIFIDKMSKIKAKSTKLSVHVHGKIFGKTSVCYWWSKLLNL